MNMTRRNFFIGGAAFASLGAFAGNRFIPVIAGAAVPAGARPLIRFGLLSDIHISRFGAGEKMSQRGNNLMFKHTLEWFRSQNVDAVVIAGDMADYGMDVNLMAVSEAWYSVFPDDKYPDGRPIEKVFVTGNHDWHGYRYGNVAVKKYPDPAERAKHILQMDMKGWWRKAFHEDYSPLFAKTIKGFTFVGAHWDTSGERAYEYKRLKGWLDKNAKSLDPKMPFFYVQHPHLKNTCYGSWAWGQDVGNTTQALSAFPNAIAFSGHSHYSLTDERTIWQGAFTSVGTGSLTYTARLGNHENTCSSDWRVAARKLLKKIDTGDCRQGMLWSVYDDRIVVRRREFLSDLDLGTDWVMPLTVAESRPFAFAEHAKRHRAPEFPVGAAPVVTEVNAKNRGGTSKDGKEKIPSVRKPSYKVVVPPVLPDNMARLFNLEFVATSEDGKSQTKRLLAKGFNHSLKHPFAKRHQVCYFRKDELGSGKVRFTVTPMNCFGARGKTISTTV